MDAPLRAPLILIVDDDAQSAGALARLLRTDGYEVEVTTDGATALGRLTRNPIPSALVTEFHLPHADGLAVGRYARSRHALMPIFILTNYPHSFPREVDPVDGPPVVRLTKPLDYPELLRSLTAVLGLPVSM